MKSVASVVVALGLLLVMAVPSLAHDHWAGHGGYHHHPVYTGIYYYGGCPTVVVAHPPVYTNYPPVVAPVYVPVVPSAGYYYGVPGVSLGYRGPRVRIGVGF